MIANILRKADIDFHRQGHTAMAPFRATTLCEPYPGVKVPHPPSMFGAGNQICGISSGASNNHLPDHRYNQSILDFLTNLNPPTITLASELNFWNFYSNE